ncbi:MAG: DnaJ domain-containing protein [Candidatus Omnitrophica bacterium]|nr:DnaJ domain-containing protein [Candidatus Omnitrophota bacterium]
MLNFRQIDEARKVLGLDEEASMEEIKDAYRNLALKYHPDRCKEKDKKHCEEMLKKVNYAKDTIGSYCANYRYSFKEKEVKKHIMPKEEYEHLKRFYDGWFGELDL